MRHNLSFNQLLELHGEATQIYRSDLSWEAKYDLIFSDRISAKIALNYYDPDSSYEDDVTAFMKALDDYMGGPL